MMSPSTAVSRSLCNALCTRGKWYSNVDDPSQTHSLRLPIGTCTFSASLRLPEDAALNAHAAIPKLMYRQPFYFNLRFSRASRVTSACL